MYNMLAHAHSGLRWVVLLLLIVAIGNAFASWKGQKSFQPKDKKLGLFAMTFTHIQFLIGLVLYFISPKVVFDASSMKNPTMRFFLVEHLVIMIIAIAVITIGYSRAKRIREDAKKFRTTFVFFLIGLILILAGIPWPFRGYGTGWF